MAQSGSLPPGPQRVLVLLLDGVHALDFAGPVQAIYEAKGFGAEYRLEFVSTTSRVRSAQGFVFGDLAPLPDPSGAEWIVVPGTESSALDSIEVPANWLRGAWRRGCRVSSICSGAFVLARAGLLEGRRCTTHWKVVDRLREWCPTAEVLENRLFVRDGQLITSAGEASGIDMALFLIEEDWGSRVAAQVAREMVIYVRRDGRSAQKSVYLENRSHLHPGVHRVQDWIVQNPDQSPNLEELARIAALSSRHLTRVFRQATGTTLKSFATRVKLEAAQNLMDTNRTIAQIAGQCGFKDARQFRRLWRDHFGHSPSEHRSRGQAARRTGARNPRGEGP